MDKAILAILTGEKSLIDERTVYGIFWLVIGIAALIYIARRLYRSHGKEIKQFAACINYKNVLFILWSVVFIPIIIITVMWLGIEFAPEKGVNKLVLALPFICLHGIYIMSRVQIKNRILKAFIIALYVCFIIYALLAGLMSHGFKT